MERSSSPRGLWSGSPVNATHGEALEVSSAV